MAVIGIEFTSAIAQVIFIVLLAAVVGTAIWLIRRLRQTETQLASIRRENGKLRNEIANITGWTTNGRLPEDWQERLRNDKAVPGIAPPPVGTEVPGELVLAAAHHALASVEPPHFASGDSADEVSRAHRRNIDLIEGLAAERIDPVLGSRQWRYGQASVLLAASGSLFPRPCGNRRLRFGGLCRA